MILTSRSAARKILLVEMENLRNHLTYSKVTNAVMWGVLWSCPKKATRTVMLQLDPPTTTTRRSQCNVNIRAYITHTHLLHTFAQCCFLIIIDLISQSVT